jgi:RND family efflux transporter MFP subunit
MELAMLSLALLVLAPLAACSPDSQASEVSAEDEGYVKVVNVEVEEIDSVAFTSYIRLTGEIEALRDVVVSAEESGVIERYLVQKGDYVKRGAPLAKIEDDVLSAQVEEARASAQLAAERYERQRRLWEEEKIGSEIAFLETKYQAELQEAQLKMLQARLDRTLIRAPLAGIFDERYAEAGEMVTSGARVGRIVEVDRLKVNGGVAERFAPSVEVGDTARVTLAVLPGQEFVGVIEYVGAAVDQRNRTFPIEAIIENPRMVANIEIVDAQLESALVVPQPAILRTENGYQVFVAAEQDGHLVAKPRAVQVGPTHANRTVIKEGLEAGDRVIVRGQQLVEAGNRVKVVERLDEASGTN